MRTVFMIVSFLLSGVAFAQINCPPPTSYFPEHCFDLARAARNATNQAFNDCVACVNDRNQCDGVPRNADGTLPIFSDCHNRAIVGMQEDILVGTECSNDAWDDHCSSSTDPNCTRCYWCPDSPDACLGSCVDIAFGPIELAPRQEVIRLGNVLIYRQGSVLMMANARDNESARWVFESTGRPPERIENHLEALEAATGLPAVSKNCVGSRRGKICYEVFSDGGLPVLFGNLEKLGLVVEADALLSEIVK